MRLAVGTSVVYPGHGVGRILTRQKDEVVLELSNGLRVTLPIERARGLLRPPLAQTDLCQVQETLRLVPPPNEDNWAKRKKDTELKLTHGDPIGLAEVVRDGALRERRLLARQSGSFLSASERSLNTRARRLLTGEIGLANDLEPAEAEAWIDEQLNQSAPR